MGNDAKRRLAVAAAFLMAATAGSRVLGLFREQVMLYYLGLGPAMGAFTVAFKVPSLIRTLVADTALSAAFIPVFSELLAEQRRKEAWRLVTTVTFCAVVVLGAISALGVVFAPQVIRVAAPGFYNAETIDTEMIALAIGLTQVMFPTVMLLGVTGIFMGVLNSYDHFTLPALAPILWNVIIIASVVFFAGDGTDLHGFYVLAWGTVIGTVAQLVIQVPAVWRRRERGGLRLDFRHPALKQVARLLGPVMLTLGIVNFNALIGTQVASYISYEAPAYIDKAFRLFQLPQGMFAVAIGTVLFPTLSRLAAAGRIDDFRSTLSSGVRQIFFVTLPFSAFFVVLGVPTVRLVFQHGKVVPEDTAAVAWALAFFSVGMAFVSANTLLNRAFYGIQKAWLPLIVGVGNLILYTTLAVLLYKPLGVGGVTFATSVVSVFNFFGLTFLLRREIGRVDGRRTAISVFRSIVALFPLAAAGYGSWWVADAWLGRSVLGQLVSVSAGYAVGLAAYVLAARMLRMDELGQVAGVIRRRREPRDVRGVVPLEDADQG
ncbi:MAG: murein biosynthesis integral membrane protein MurJ [Thermoleophilia bacterium]